MVKLSNDCIRALKGKKSLLAFSHGTDSSALFNLLLNENIDFDCAFINYKTRAQSDDEQNSAIELCNKFNKKIFIKLAELNLENGSNFEHIAREIRYKFFDEIIKAHNYDNLIIAHNLNDRFEWFMMQFIKGAGVCNLISMPMIEKKENYTIIRPLITTSKEQILNYLKSNNIKFFYDSSNDNEKFKRNFIRKNFTNDLINLNLSGIKKSFEILQSEKNLMLGEFISEKFDFFIIKKSEFCINLIDKACKNLGLVISYNQREEIKKGDCVLSGKIAICSDKSRFYVCKFIKIPMDKKFKEKCRILRIPPLLRGYIYQNQQILDLF